VLVCDRLRPLRQPHPRPEIVVFVNELDPAHRKAIDSYDRPENRRASDNRARRRDARHGRCISVRMSIRAFNFLAVLLAIAASPATAQDKLTTDEVVAQFAGRYANKVGASAAMVGYCQVEYSRLDVAGDPWWDRRLQDEPGATVPTKQDEIRLQHAIISVTLCIARTMAAFGALEPGVTAD